MAKLEDKKIKFLQKSKEANEKAIVYLADELVKKRLAIFVGAGCSIAAGLPLWGRLILDIKTKFKIKTNETDLLRIAAKIEKEIGALSFREEISERIKTHPQAPTSIHEAVTKIDANLFITTNYDSLLEDTFRNKGIAPIVITQDRDIPFVDPTKKTIVKLHGDINSPSSIVITLNDYYKYNLEHVSFSDWLKAKAVQNTILFVGTSFVDQRLKDTDEYVLKRFGEFRRSPCIFLKFPEQRKEVSNENYSIELGDFEILCEEFKTKGFYLIIINDYKEIIEILNKVNTLFLQKKIQESPADLATQITFKTIHTERLEKDLADICDEKIKELCGKVWGDGSLPTQEVMRSESEKLLHYLNEKDHLLNAESKLEGFITLTDVFLNLEKKGHINNARKYYDRANATYQKIANQSKWKERFSRITAKLYFFEGKIDAALALVAHSDDDKTISFWLTLLIDSNRFDVAYEFVSKNEIKIPWLPEALCILIILGKNNEAENKFNEFRSDFEKKVQEKLIPNSLYKNEHFYDKVCSFMADAYFRRAIISAGKTGSVVYPQDIDDQGRVLCLKSIEYADKIFAQPYGETVKSNLKDYYFAYCALIIKLQALYFIGDYSKADELVEYIIPIKPIAHEAAEYVALRVVFIKKELVVSTIDSLLQDYPEQSWAMLLIAILQLDGLKERDKAWDSALKVLKQTSNDTEKERSGGIIFEIGMRANKVKEAQTVINDFLPPESMWKEYWDAIYQDFIGNSDKSLEILNNIENRNPIPELNALCKYTRSLAEIKRGDYQKAYQLLGESKKMYPSYATLRKLLEVEVKLQNDIGTLEAAEQIERLGMMDDTVRHIKAQAARNAGYFEKSEQSWKSLLGKYPNNSETAYGYAEVLALQEKYDEALKIINSFTNCDETLSTKCLMLACHILCAIDKEKEAFALLDKCRTRFQDIPELLLQHTELGFRIDEEQKAHESLMRLEQLRQENKIPEQIFAIKNIDEIKEFIHRRHEAKEKLDEHYRLGQIPRLFFCSYYNIPLYLDWAYRTQAMSVLPEWPFRIEFNTYATNGFRVQFIERNQLVPIAISKDVKEIVIDYPAMITLHRLGFLSKLLNRFDAVYYPYLLQNIWTIDSQRYKHHQASQVKVYRNLHKKLEMNLIKVIEAPALQEKAYKNIAERDIYLAKTENVPLISAYMEREEIPQDLLFTLLRFRQVLDHLYRKGKISETRLLELKKLVKDREDIAKEEVSEVLDNALRLVFDEITLELAEKYDLIEPIIDSGFQIIIERATYQNIQHAIRSIEFSEEVIVWQKDLESQVKNIETSNKTKFFKAVPIILRLGGDRKELHYYDMLAIETLQCAENKKLPLLTDDRFSQMIRTQHLGDKQFGSDALIKDLYNKRVISINEYANAFLKLCEWRYRFLVPEAEILAYFIEQYQNNSLGKPLDTLIKYSNDCMEDRGLFFGLERTDPPTMCGVKLYMQWIEAWVQALTKIWINPNVSEKNREEITRQIFLRALPKGPEGLRPDIRKNITAISERFIITHLFVATIECNKPGRFKGLFDLAFESLGFSPERQVNELRMYLEESERNFGKKGKGRTDVSAAIAIRALKAFYGDEYLKVGRKIDEKLIPALLGLGVDISMSKVNTQELQNDSISSDNIQRIINILSEKTKIERRNITEYQSGPLIFVPPTEIKGGEIITPHDMVMSDVIELRKAALDTLLSEDYTSKYTKNYIKERIDKIASDKPFVWQLSAKEVQEILLKDIQYIIRWFKQLEDTRISFKTRESLFREIASSIFEPSVDSIISSLPFLLEEPFNANAIQERVKLQTSKVGNINEFLNWYLENVYFIPYVANNSVYSMLKEACKEEPKYILEMTTNWLNSNKNDHLAWLLALEIVLNLRAEHKKDDSVFNSDDFYKFLDDIFRTLLLSSKLQMESSDPRINNMALRWKMRQEFARYYLRYLDINMKKEFDDERKIALSWWLAKAVSSSVLNSSKDFAIADQSAYIEKVLESLERRFSIMRFQHQLTTTLGVFSSTRYFVFNVQDLLSYAVSGLLTLKEKEDYMTLRGLKFPTAALSPEVRKILINKLIEDILSGNGQLSDDSKILKVLWNNSLCRSFPDFLKRYYEETLSFLGEEIHGKVMKAEEISSFANAVSAKNFLDSELAHFAEYVDKNDQQSIILIISSLKVYILTNKGSDLSKDLIVFNSNPNILDKISRFEKPLASLAISALVEILLNLQHRGDNNGVQIFVQQFKKIDYKYCEINIIELILTSLIIFVMIGGDYSILGALLNKRNEEKKIRDLIRKIKPFLESLLPYVQLGHRDNLRRILNDFSGIA